MRASVLTIYSEALKAETALMSKYIPWQYCNYYRSYL